MAFRMCAEELRIVLIGKTGAGKSATGNTLVGKREFDSKISSQSVTKVSKAVSAERFGRKIKVIDTPGFFDTETDELHIYEEIRKSVQLSEPGPHVFILVVQPGRFTEEEQKVFGLVRNAFGDGILDRLLVVFVRRDDLDEAGVSVKQYVRGAPWALKKILNKIDNRYTALNNRSDRDEKEEQAIDLLTRIDNMVDCCHGTHYTVDLLKDAQLRR